MPVGLAISLGYLRPARSWKPVAAYDGTGRPAIQGKPGFVLFNANSTVKYACSY